MLWWVIPLAILGLGLVLVAYGVFIERRWYRVSRYRLDILPGGQKGALSVLHLSDLHFVQRDERKAKFLASLPQPDITIVTGDLLGEAEAVSTVTTALRPVRGRLASYFVLGSNDYFRPRPTLYFRYFFGRTKHRGRPGSSRDLVASLETDGWSLLKNERMDVSLNGTRIEVTGLDDPHIHRHDIRAAVRRSPDLFGLAIVHSPDPAPELVALGYDLIGAGHTHGGQVRMPIIGALVTNGSVPRRMARGLIRLGPAFLHVSPGMGTSKYAPFRFLCRPEATLLELSGKGR